MIFYLPKLKCSTCCFTTCALAVAFCTLQQHVLYWYLKFSRFGTNFMLQESFKLQYAVAEAIRVGVAENMKGFYPFALNQALEENCLPATIWHGRRAASSASNQYCSLLEYFHKL